MLEHSIRVQDEKSAQIIGAIHGGISGSVDNISVQVPVEIDTPLEVTVSNAWEFDFS